MSLDALGISVALEAALARDEEPRPPVVGWLACSGLGTEGRMFWVPASLGIVVPVAAIEEISPPWWGSVGMMEISIFSGDSFGFGRNMSLRLVWYDLYLLRCVLLRL